MSLLRLLTAGKSLVGLKKLEGRYRLPGARTLPKFGSKKNPFRATVVPEKAEPAEPGPALAPEERSPEQRGKGDENASVETPRVAEKPALARTAAADLPGAEPQKDCRVAPDQDKTPGQPAFRPSGIRAFLLWGRARRVKPLGARNGRPMVQGELSLDSVKVVRNDLSESDLEVVRTDGIAAPINATPHIDTTSMLKQSEPGWSAAAGRLFGLGKS
jgi:hypothetical protein